MGPVLAAGATRSAAGTALAFGGIALGPVIILILQLAPSRPVIGGGLYKAQPRFSSERKAGRYKHGSNRLDWTEPKNIRCSATTRNVYFISLECRFSITRMPKRGFCRAKYLVFHKPAASIHSGSPPRVKFLRRLHHVHHGGIPDARATTAAYVIS